VSGDRSGLPAVAEHAAPIAASTLSNSLVVPAMIAEAGDRAARRFLDFFAASIENDNTRMAYYRAVCPFFAWLEEHGLGELADIEPFHVAAYLKALRVSDAGDRTINERTAARPIGPKGPNRWSACSTNNSWSNNPHHNVTVSPASDGSTS